MSRPTVAVIGGGYAGTRVAKALDEDAEVTLVEPRDAFHHNVAALRGLVDPAWLPKTFFPYGQLLRHGTVVRDRAVSVAADEVVLASGLRLRPEFLVLATGSTYPFPAKTDHLTHAAAIAEYERAHASLARADRVLLLGAGAVGLELAGEIVAAWPEKRVSIVDPSTSVLPGPYPDDLRQELTRQLAAAGVELRIGVALKRPLTTEPGNLDSFTAELSDGSTIEADLWLRCHGTTPVTDYLGPGLAKARTTEGYLAVDEHLRVAGEQRVFALGDVAAADVNRVGIARRQADVVAANIRAMMRLAGSAGTEITGAVLTTYAVAPTGIILPLGPANGAGTQPGHGLLGADAVSRLKGADMFIGQYAEFFG